VGETAEPRVDRWAAWTRGWLGPIGIPVRLGRRILFSCQHLDSCLPSLTVWLGLAALIGTVPVLLDYALGLSTHRLVSALLATPLLMAAVSRDREARALAFLIVLFGTHSALVITLARIDPVGLSPVCPGGADYWDQTRAWITTGISKEYDVSWWLPAHGQIILVVIALSYTSLGLVPLWHGLYEVDLMNFYVGQLLAQAATPGPNAVLAWHPWSLCRGFGFLFVIYEVVSLSLSRLSGVSLSPWPRRARRWGLGLGFLVLDAIVKFFSLEPVRQLLAGVLG